MKSVTNTPDVRGNAIDQICTSDLTYPIILTHVVPRTLFAKSVPGIPSGGMGLRCGDLPRPARKAASPP